MAGLGRQLRDNLVAITSLAVALSALGYNTWRNERTEGNRNVRVAGIELLREIGSLQQVIFYAHYVADDPRGELRMGWVDTLTINDLATVMPQAVGENARQLRAVWEANVTDLDQFTSEERRDRAFVQIDQAIDALRQATLESLRELD